MQPMLYPIPSGQRAVADAASRLMSRVMPHNAAHLQNLAALVTSGIDRLLAIARRTEQGQLGFGLTSSPPTVQSTSPLVTVDQIRRPLDELASTVNAILGDIRVAGPAAGRPVLQRLAHLACELRLTLSRLSDQIHEARSTATRMGEGQPGRRLLEDLLRDETRLRTLSTELEQIPISASTFLNA